MAYTGKKPIDVIDATTAQTLTIENNIVTPSINSSQIGGRRNLIINGAMNVAQRSTSVTGIGASDGYFTVDRFNINVGDTSAGRLTMTQTADGPSGFANCIKLDCTTADTSIAAGEFLILEQRFEGQDLQRFMKGTSDAKEYAVSFYVKGNASATYVVELFDIDNTRRVGKTFSVTTSWTRVELTFPADTTGAFGDDANQSLNMHIFLHAGSSFASGTLSQTWILNASNEGRAAGGDSFFDSTDRTFFITGVQLEVGSVATEFEHRSFGEELALCQRYYEKNYPQGTAPASSSTLSKGSFVVHSSATITYRWSQQFKVTKRAAPTSVIYSTTGASGNVRLNNGSDLAVTIEDSGDSGFAVYALNRSSTGGEFYWWNWVADAEL